MNVKVHSKQSLSTGLVHLSAVGGEVSTVSREALVHEHV